MESGIWVIENFTIQSDDVQQIQVLAFVFVEPFDLNIKEGIGAYGDPTLLLNDPG
jgi:hypothetical protein